MSSWNTEANLGTKHCTYIDSVNQNTIKNTFWAPFSSLPPKQSITSKILEIEKRSIKSFVIFSEQTIGEVFIARLLKNKKPNKSPSTPENNQLRGYLELYSI